MTGILDMFGNPIRAAHGGKGRPAYQPTVETCNTIIGLLSFGWSNERIAAALEISVPTLKTHYSAELEVRDAAQDIVVAGTLEKLNELAESGSVSAIKERQKLYERQMLMAARFGDVGQNADKKPSRTKLGKKEQALAEARAPDESSPSGRAAARRANQPNSLN